MSFLDRMGEEDSPNTPTVDTPTITKLPTRMSFLDRLRGETNKVQENALLGNEPLEISGTLKMNDLEKNPAYTNGIREYMVRRKGVQYEEMDAEQLVDDFTKHMRYFNVNEAIITALNE